MLLHLPYKSYDFFLTNVQRLVASVYKSNLGGDFMPIMDHLIDGQLTDAYQSALNESGLSPDEVTESMKEQLQGFIEEQQGYVEGFYKDIIDAQVDGHPSLDSLLTRAQSWANRWNEVYHAALTEITAEMGGKLIWKEGDTKDKCNTCVSLDGIVAFATEWQQAGFQPQGDMLDCHGDHCRCSLTPTSARRSPNALTRLLDIATARNL